MNRTPYRVEAAGIDERFREAKSELRLLYTDKDEFQRGADDLLQTYREDKKALESSWRNQNPRRPIGRKYLDNGGQVL